jgi:hypothetical protein
VDVSSETADLNPTNNTATEDTTVLEGEPPVFILYFPILNKDN